jgi:hypothetical protein
MSPRTAGVALAVLWLLAAIPVANGRVRDWVSNYPAQSESWVDGLLAEHPEPPDGAMWIIDAPFAIAILDGYIAGPMLAVIYGREVPARVVTAEQFAFVKDEWVEPGDAIYWWPEARAAAEP